MEHERGRAMDERTVKWLLEQDLSVGTDEFRDKLLSKCLDVLCAEDSVIELDDADLDMLAAAGDINAAIAPSCHETDGV